MMRSRGQRQSSFTSTRMINGVRIRWRYKHVKHKINVRKENGQYKTESTCVEVSGVNGSENTIAKEILSLLCQLGIGAVKI